MLTIAEVVAENDSCNLWRGLRNGLMLAIPLDGFLVWLGILAWRAM